MAFKVNKDLKIAVVGASGVVGEVMLQILAERGYSSKQVTALASERSAGEAVEFGNFQLVLIIPRHFATTTTSPWLSRRLTPTNLRESRRAVLSPIQIARPYRW